MVTPPNRSDPAVVLWRAPVLGAGFLFQRLTRESETWGEQGWVPRPAQQHPFHLRSETPNAVADRKNSGIRGGQTPLAAA